MHSGRVLFAGQRLAGALHAQVGPQPQLGPQVHGLQLQAFFEQDVVIGLLLGRPPFGRPSI